MNIFDSRRRYPSWHRKARVMKTDDRGGHTPTPSPTPTPTGGNNSGGGGGNSGQGGGESNNDNNGGGGFDFGQFWADAPEEASPSPQSGGSAGGGNQSGASPGQQEQTPAQRLGEDLKGLTFDVPVMSEAVMKDLAEGKTDSFQTALTQHGQQVATQTMRLAIGIMGQMRDQMRSEFKNELSSGFNSRETAADLEKAIPSAKNPAVRPMVDSILERSLKITKGDRPAAIQMTKDMLAFTAKTMGNDIGLPPPSPGDTGGLIPSNTNWLEELTGRS